MPFVSHQTFLGVSTPPLSTNWGTATTLNNTFSVAAPAGVTPSSAPRVGTRVLTQSPSSDVPNSFVNYTNNIAGTWNQYTIEGWLVARPKNSWAFQSTTREITIGVPGAYNRIVIQIIPNDATSQFLISGVWYDGAGNNQALASGGAFFPYNAWTYFSLVKQNNNSRYMMINGGLPNAISTTFANETPATTGSSALQIGSTANVNTTMPVIWDQFRISNVARYSATQTYTPPSTAFTNDVNTWFLSSWENTYVPAPSPT